MCKAMLEIEIISRCCVSCTSCLALLLPLIVIQYKNGKSNQAITDLGILLEDKEILQCNC